MASEHQLQVVESIAGDRRADRRYALRLDLRWKLIRRRRVLESGLGRSLDLSSGGILIEADRQLPVGLNMEISVAWPVMLHNVAPMQLVISGRIVRVVGNRVAIRMSLHEFRTAGAATDQRAALSLAGSRISTQGKPLSFKAT